MESQTYARAERAWRQHKRSPTSQSTFACLDAELQHRREEGTVDLKPTFRMTDDPRPEENMLVLADVLRRDRQGEVEHDSLDEVGSFEDLLSRVRQSAT